MVQRYGMLKMKEALLYELKPSNNYQQVLLLISSELEQIN